MEPASSVQSSSAAPSGEMAVSSPVSEPLPRGYHAARGSMWSLKSLLLTDAPRFVLQEGYSVPLVEQQKERVADRAPDPNLEGLAQERS